MKGRREVSSLSSNRLEDDAEKERQGAGSRPEGCCNCGVVQRGWGLRKESCLGSAKLKVKGMSSPRQTSL